MEKEGKKTLKSKEQHLFFVTKHDVP